jgi:[protein-PII] uridylyltransferase
MGCEAGTAARLSVINETDATPESQRASLAALAESTLADLADEHLPSGWALATLAGTAKRELCPFSDLDVVLLHPDGEPEARVAAVASACWYPLWDAGWKLSPLTHSPKTLQASVRRDLETATSLLSIRHISGEPTVTEQARTRSLRAWKDNGEKWVGALAASVDERHRRHGEVAFLLEPDLKEGIGGLRDIHAIDWMIAAGIEGLETFLEVPRATLDEHLRTLLDVRTALHAATRRPGDRLLLQDQLATAQRFGISDDDLMQRVSSAGREVQWVAERFWERWATRGRRGGKPKRFTLGPHVEMIGDRVRDRTDAKLDAVALLRLGAIAAHSDATIDSETLERLVAEVEPLIGPWPDGARQHFVSLLGAGQSAIRVLEALDRFRLLERVLPEWSAVRCKPQRNAYHRYTVDRHLCETAVQAAALVRRVHRPDLLLVGALLHDIGKGFPGDHTIVGMELVRDIGARMGYSPDDVEVLVSMVEHHLTVPETATRRDLSDPATIAMMARAVGRIEVLELLAALTEADSRATGPSAWSEWKGGLIQQLVRTTRAHMLGESLPPSLDAFPTVDHHRLLDEIRTDGRIRFVPGKATCVVAAPDRTGLLATVAGALAVHGVEVLSAKGWSSDDGVAIEEFRIERRLGGDPPWARIEADLRGALAGETDLAARLRERARVYAGAARRVSAAPAAPADVLIDQHASANATLIEVRAPDSVGALYRVATTIASLGLDIRAALVQTLGHEVVDVFYVCDGDGRKLRAQAAVDARTAVLASFSE